MTEFAGRVFDTTVGLLPGRPLPAEGALRARGVNSVADRLGRELSPVRARPKSRGPPEDNSTPALSTAPLKIHHIIFEKTSRSSTKTQFLVDIDDVTLPILHNFRPFCPLT